MKNNNKILLLVKFEPFGGTKIGFENLINFYEQNKFDVIIVYYKENMVFDYLLYFNKYKFPFKLINKNKIFIKSFPIFNIFINQVLNFIKIFFIIITQRPNLLVVSDWDVTNFASLLMLPVKTINIVNSYPTRKISFLNYFIRLMAKNILFLTVSDFAKNQIINFWLNNKYKNNVEMVYNYVSDKKNKSARRLDEPFKVLTLGHVVWYKNPDIWLKVARKVIENNSNKQIEFIWAGNGELLENYKEYLKKENLENIKFIGFQKDLDCLYKNAAIYFQPSKIESFGLSVADATSWGVPCVVSSAGGLPEIINNNENGFVIDIFDIDDYVEKISLLLNDVNLNRRMGELGLKNFGDKFTKELYIKKMIILHEKILLK